jgi:hypothetical protein
MSWETTTLNIGSCCRLGFSHLSSVESISRKRDAKLANLQAMRASELRNCCITVLKMNISSRVIQYRACASSIEQSPQHR